MTSRLVEVAHEKWRQSGISPQQAKRLGFSVVTGDKMQSLSPSYFAIGGIRIDYCDLKGKRTDFHRVRYLEDLPGFDGQKEKKQKYAQPPKTGCKAYFPPTLKWGELANDVSQEIIITEGEFKAACGAIHSFNVIGLGGVFSFRSASSGVAFLPELNKIKWDGRTVYIVFDNDITHKVEVMRAQKMLAEELLARGARVFIANLPPGPLKGMDDFIVGRGEEEFKQVLQFAQEYSASRELHAFNERFVYLRAINGVIERDKPVVEGLHKPDNFVRHAFCNEYMYEKGFTKGKNPQPTLTKVPIAKKWMEWEQRAAANKLVYEPGKASDYQGNWNTWHSWGVEPKKGNIKPWKDLLDFLFRDDPKFRVWFERWLAYPIQNPGAKMYSAVLIWSRVKRLGKTLMSLYLQKIYGENCKVIGSKDLKGQFNSWQAQTQFVIGEEITAGEARQEADFLKTLVTQEFVTIDEKFKPKYTVRDVMNHLYFSNHPDALSLEDGDERFAVYSLEHTTPMPETWYIPIDKHLREGNDGAAAVMYHLLHLPLGDFNPKAHPPQTVSKQEMIVQSKNEVALWIHRMKEESAALLQPLGHRVAEGCDLFTVEQLIKAFDPEGRKRMSPQAMSKALRNAGHRQLCGSQPINCGTKIRPRYHRLWAVRNIVEWDQYDSRRKIVEHYNQFFGPQVLGELK